MTILIKKATILCKQSSHHKQVRDVFIQDGVIKKIASSINEKADQVIESKGLHVSVGWMDVGVQSGEPGYEQREDFSTLKLAASSGGYTALACFPNTSPSVHSKSEVLYFKNSNYNTLVELYPIGAVSRNCKGEDITEMIDMHHSGAIAFSDGNHPVQDSGFMLRSLQYVKAFGGVIINHPHDESIAGKGLMHEGATSTSLGMKGVPKLAEDIMLLRDIRLNEYAQSRLHIHSISASESVVNIRKAKAEGRNITASVAVANLIFTQDELLTFDSNYKVMPPLRMETDRAALIEGLQDGTIDFITTDHTPLEEEAKKLEFPYADFGIIGLETAFAALNTYTNLDIELIIEKLSHQVRNVFNMDQPNIEEDEKANITLFLPEEKWTLNKNDIQSKSQNSPFIGKELKGKVLGVINNNQSTFFDIL